ncbi:hypothetical protein Tco_1013658 [Tanacetum coccineum]
MSSYTHPSIPSDYDVEDAFSSTNAPNYIPTPPGYSPVTPGNISPDSSDHLTKDLLSSLSISPFHDDPYMKVIQAYDVIPPPQVIIALPTIVPPPMFDSRDLFPLEEISPPKDNETPVESPIPVSPSLSVGSSSPVRSTTSPPDYPLISYLSGHDASPPKRTSTSAAPAMTQAAIKKLVAGSIAVALEAQAATMANTNRNTGTIGTPVARKGTNNHKRNFDDRRNTTTNKDNNYSNNRNNNNYRDNQNNHNRNNDYHQQQNRMQETIRTYAATLTEKLRCQYANKVGHRTGTAKQRTSPLEKATCESVS